MAASNTPAMSNFTGPIVIDPLTRLEGHLRIEVEVENGKVKNAYSCGTLFRGLENILVGRDPQDAQHITQRACGVCTYTHALASTRAVDNAVKVQLPPLAVSIRNLALAAHFMHDHMVHFYHLHALDFVNVANALNADANKAAAVLAARPGNTTNNGKLWVWVLTTKYGTCPRGDNLHFKCIKVVGGGNKVKFRG